jgi:hypothetical protein
MQSERSKSCLLKVEFNMHYQVFQVISSLHILQLIFCPMHPTYPTHLILLNFITLNNAWWRLQILKLLIMQFYACSSPLGPDLLLLPLSRRQTAHPYRTRTLLCYICTGYGLWAMSAEDMHVQKMGMKTEWGCKGARRNLENVCVLMLWDVIDTPDLVDGPEHPYLLLWRSCWWIPSV